MVQADWLTRLQSCCRSAVEHLNARISDLVSAQIAAQEEAKRSRKQLDDMKLQHRQELSKLESAQTQLRHALQSVQPGDRATDASDPDAAGASRQPASGQPLSAGAFSGAATRAVVFAIHAYPLVVSWPETEREVILVCR